MATLYIEPVQESGDILHLVRSAIESEVAKLELALKMADRLRPSTLMVVIRSSVLWELRSR